MAKLPEGLKGKSVSGAVEAVASEELQKQVASELILEDTEAEQDLDEIVAKIKANESDCFCSEQSAPDVFPPGATEHECNEDTQKHD